MEADKIKEKRKKRKMLRRKRKENAVAVEGNKV